MSNDKFILNLREQIINYAKSIGFDLIKFTSAKIDPKYKKAFKDWLKNQRHGDMVYMEKIKERFDMRKVLPCAKTVIVLGTNYYREQAPLKRAYGRIARYAYGRDYHKVIGKRLKELEKFIAEITAFFSQAQVASSGPVPGPKAVPVLTKSYVDTGPIMERALAQQAGIGRIGKNGCVISKEFGSWIFLSEVITTLDLNFSQEMAQPQGFQIAIPHVGNSTDSAASPEKHKVNTSFPPLDRWSNPQEKIFNVCGNCTRCMTACPTGAIIAPGVIDSRLCISYLTIENRGKISPKLAKTIKKTKRLFGCDICQEVCPHNIARQQSASAPAACPPLACAQAACPPLAWSHKALPASGIPIPTHWPKIAGDQLELKKINGIKTPEEFTKIFTGSPLMRAKKEGLARNAEVLTEAKFD